MVRARPRPWRSSRATRRRRRARCACSARAPRTGARCVPGMGIMLQEGGFAAGLTVEGSVRLIGRLSERQDTVARVLELVNLAHRADTRVAQLSGGEKRRLDFATAVYLPDHQLPGARAGHRAAAQSGCPRRGHLGRDHRHREPCAAETDSARRLGYGAGRQRLERQGATRRLHAPAGSDLGLGDGGDCAGRADVPVGARR